jgi:polysaccharide biosynthesis/export protein
MVSNFQFLAKALRFPATAPTLLALSLTAFVASQLHDRLSSQAFPGLADDQDSDNSPEEDTREPAAPPSSQAVPEQLPLEISPLEGIPDLTLSPREVMEGIQGSALVADGAKILPNLEVTLPQPVAPVTSLKTTPPQTRGLGVSGVRVSPQVVEAVVTQSLAYKTVAGSTGISRESSQGSTDWIDLEGHWSKPYVEALAGLGLIEGLPDGHFEPDRPMTRAELADLLQRSLPRPQLRPGLTPLNDVPAQHWAAQSIEQAVGMGFFPDVESTGAFNPDRPASRLVTWGAIVSGLNLPSSKQHNELLQAWEASRAHPLANTPNSATPNSNTLQAELSQPVTRGEVAALLYHALRLTDEGQKLAEIVPAQTPSTSTATASTLAQETHSASSIVPPSIPTSTIETSTLPVSTIATSTIAPSSTIPTSTPRTTETIPLQSSGAIEPLAPPIETLSPPPLLVAAQLPLPDPLLSPLPPVSAETSGSIGSDDLGLAPASPREAQVERVSPEFSAEPLSLDPLNSPDLASSAEVTPTQNSVNTTFADPLPLDETYTLGAGDRVFIEVFGLPQYSQEYQILVDGSLNLPRAGRMVVEGMTLAQAESLIYARYARYYQQPATSVVLVAPRSLRISVTGEVNRPGVYRLSPSEGSAVLNLTQALQEAGGIRQDADLRQIKVYRSQRDGTPQELSLNLWSLLQTGDLTQDISLRDGDRVIIPKAESFNIEDVNQMATANIAPSTINITVVGSDAANQGSLQVSPNTPLNQVVLAAGGFNDRRESRTVNLIRLHPNGTVEQRLLEVPIAASVNEDNNPILRDKDVIVLDRSKGNMMRENALGFLGKIMRVIPFVNLLF